jgi:light-regulated signal transduction histidine kinase (bacteriophytochrome)
LSNIGKLSNPKELVPFVEVVQEALSQAAEMLKSSQAEITISENFPVVNIDRARIVDVLVNLINNCIRYAGDENPPCIEIGHYSAGVETVFFVKDKGVGIDPSVQKSIFMLFHKDKDSGSHDVGLGLSRRIIEAHGGHMWIESEPKKGCTVYFKIPSK